MRPSLRLRDLAGWLALALMVALASPGVTAIRAENGERAALEAGPACQVDAQDAAIVPHAVSVDLSRAASQAAQSGSAGVIRLDTEGYHYGAETPEAGDRASIRIVLQPLP